MAFDPEQYTHESDRKALTALRAIPGFSALLKGFLSVWNERQQKILNMSSRIRISDTQMKKYYDMLPPICEKLGIDIPELYLEMNVVPNSYTSGDTEPFIVLTSGLLKTVPEELIPTVLAHECGHIALHHVLYLTMGRIVLQGAGSVLASALPLGGLLSAPLQVAMYYWMRCSEFSADRAAVLCDGGPRRTQELCMRLAGWDKDIPADASLSAFLHQAVDYQDMISESKWNKVLEFLILSQATHPLMAVRATECGRWFQSSDYQIAAGKYLASPAHVSAPPARVGDGQARSAQQEKQAAASSTGPVSLPADYQPLGDSRTDSARYGRENTQSRSVIELSRIGPDESLCGLAESELIAFARDLMDEGEGLLQAGLGQTALGRPYACLLIKRRLDARATAYQLTVHLEMPDGVNAVQACFTETGSPGFREATLKGQWKRRQQNGGDAPGPWNRDPYDPTVQSGFLMNEGERPEYDPRFPLHPLTEARAFLKALIQDN